MPKALPSPAKPRIPGHDSDDENDNDNNKDDEEGIMRTVDTIDQLVEEEIKRGVPADRIIVGGFSQGCATSLVWGLTSKLRDVVAGVVCASGYFPLAKRIGQLRRERMSMRGMDIEGQGQDQPRDDQEHKRKTQNTQKQWLLLHGSRDMLVSQHLFRHLSTELDKHLSIEFDHNDNSNVDNANNENHKQNINIEGHVYDGMGHSFCNEELRDILHWVERVVPP